jgi:hypothetical protein
MRARIAGVFMLAFICLLVSGCHFATKQELQQTENRLDQLEAMTMAAILDPDMSFAFGLYCHVVDPRPLDELREQLGDIADEITLPKEVDFKRMEPAPGGGEKGGWNRKPPKGKRAPKSVGSYYRMKNGKFFRVDRIKEYMPHPGCNQEFIFTVVEMWQTPNCANAKYKQKFDEMKLRATAEAIRICQAIQKCNQARPTKIWGVRWFCKGNEARLVVDFGFECWGH